MKGDRPTGTLGRLVPREINGAPQTPSAGAGKHHPSGRKAAPPVDTSADFPASGDKEVGKHIGRDQIVEKLKVALRDCRLRDGMTISIHHHFRSGDLVAVLLFQAVAALGVKDVR